MSRRIVTTMRTVNSAPVEEVKAAIEVAAPKEPATASVGTGVKFTPLLKTLVDYVYLPESLWETAFKNIAKSVESSASAANLPAAHHEANRMLLTWKRDRARWRAESEIEWASMRKEAIVALNAEKDSGGKKTINKDDIEGQCALMFEDHYRRLKEQETDIDLTMEHLEASVRSIELAIRIKTSI